MISYVHAGSSVSKAGLAQSFTRSREDSEFVIRVVRTTYSSDLLGTEASRQVCDDVSVRAGNVGAQAWSAAEATSIPTRAMLQRPRPLRSAGAPQLLSLSTVPAACFDKRVTFQEPDVPMSGSDLPSKVCSLLCLRRFLLLRSMRQRAT